MLCGPHGSGQTVKAANQLIVAVLELKVPHGTDFAALRPMLPVFLTYVLSFVYLGIYWNNHHHMLHATARVNGAILWANLHLLFWLSLVPFATGWMGENHFAPLPTAVYGAVLLMAGVAYLILRTPSSRRTDQTRSSPRPSATTGRASCRSCSTQSRSLWPSSNQWISDAIYVAVAPIWLVPDPRIEGRIRS